MTKRHEAPVKMLDEPNQSVKGTELKDKQALYIYGRDTMAKHSSVKRLGDPDLN